MSSEDFVELYFKAQEAEARLNQTVVPWAVWEQRYVWERATDITDSEVYRSRTLLDSGTEMRPPNGFTEVDEWCTGYRMVWLSVPERMILTYCEGDLSVEKCHTLDALKEAVKTASEFYKEH